MVKRAIIRLGDPTSHGGMVLEAFPALNIYGKPAAGIGHRGYCPLCKQEFVIVAGVHNFTYCGKNIAVEGMPTSCGAILIATQHQATVDDVSVSHVPAPAPLHISSSPESLVEESSYDLHFLVQGEKSGKPMPNVPYKIMLDDATELIGKTDARGLTAKVSATYPALATIIAPYYDECENDDAGSTDADYGCDSCLSDSA